MSGRPHYSPEPPDARAFSERYDRFYSRIGRAYDLAVPVLPFWRNWLGAALPHLRGTRVLEVSFGTGWLLTQYAGRFEAHGVDLNETLLEIATRNLRARGLTAHLQVGSVEALPYPDDSFDTVLNTMAFTGYPDANAAMAELHRVLKPTGRLVMIDLKYPHDGNRLGTALVAVGRRFGDLVRDMDAIFRAFELDATDQRSEASAASTCTSPRNEPERNSRRHRPPAASCVSTSWSRRDSGLRTCIARNLRTSLPGRLPQRRRRPLSCGSRALQPPRAAWRGARRGIRAGLTRLAVKCFRWPAAGRRPVLRRVVVRRGRSAWSVSSSSILPERRR